MENKVLWIIAIIEFIVILALFSLVRDSSAENKEIQLLKENLTSCESDFQQDEMLIEDLQRLNDECKDGWREAIDGWDRCIRMLK